MERAAYRRNDANDFVVSPEVNREASDSPSAAFLPGLESVQDCTCRFLMLMLVLLAKPMMVVTPE
jgi:hypothetical protein